LKLGDIRDVQAFNRNAVDWTILAPLPRGCIPSDIDGFLEINRHFLFLEAKGPGGELSRGQEMALKRLADVDQITVLIVEWIPINNNTAKEITRVYPIRHPSQIVMGLAGLKKLVEAWIEDVSNK